MKIGHIDNLPAATPRATAAPADKRAAGPEASAKVALSPAASLLVDEQSADFDAEKVARIAQAIRDGKFEVNAGAIADKLIANAQELLAGPQH